MHHTGGNHPKAVDKEDVSPSVARASYSDELPRVMPTRLGNVLRQSEDRAGKQYGLDTVVIAPLMSLAAKPEHYAYVQDLQKAMDLAITMCLVGALATGTSAVLLTDDGWWSLFSLSRSASLTRPNSERWPPLARTTSRSRPSATSRGSRCTTPYG